MTNKKEGRAVLRRSKGQWLGERKVASLRELREDEQMKIFRNGERDVEFIPHM